MRVGFEALAVGSVAIVVDEAASGNPSPSLDIICHMCGAQFTEDMYYNLLTVCTCGALLIKTADKRNLLAFGKHVCVLTPGSRRKSDGAPQHKSKHTSHGRKTSQHYVMFVRWFVGRHFRAMISSFFQFMSRAVVRRHSPSI